MRRRLNFIATALLGMFLLGACRQQPHVTGGLDRQPQIFPDYADVTVPVNIAPLNFAVEEEGEAFALQLTGGGQTLEVAGDGASFDIPLQEWHALLEAAQGGEVQATVLRQDAQG